jgi:hypothetical protein
LAGVTYSFTAHAHDIFVHQRMLREKIERAHFVVAISEFNKQYLLERAPRTAPDKIKVVHCGIEPENTVRCFRRRNHKNAATLTAKRSIFTNNLQFSASPACNLTKASGI